MGAHAARRPSSAGRIAGRGALTAATALALTGGSATMAFAGTAPQDVAHEVTDGAEHAGHQAEHHGEKVKSHGEKIQHHGEKIQHHGEKLKHHGEKAQEKAEKAQDKAQDKAEDAQDKVKDKAEDAASNLPSFHDAAEDAKHKVQDVIGQADESYKNSAHVYGLPKLPVDLHEVNDRIGTLSFGELPSAPTKSSVLSFA